MSRALAYIDETHEYLDRATGEILPSVTQMIDRAGLTDTRFYTEEHRFRGSEVHRICAACDLDNFDVADLDSPYYGYVAAYLDALRVLTPTWEHVEVAMVHHLGFAGRPDRIGVMHGKPYVVELKSGSPGKSHPVQTALQAMLAADYEWHYGDMSRVPEHYQRAALYLKADGSWQIVPHRLNATDYREATRVLEVNGL